MDLLLQLVPFTSMSNSNNSSSGSFTSMSNSSNNSSGSFTSIGINNIRSFTSITAKLEVFVSMVDENILCFMFLRME